MLSVKSDTPAVLYAAVFTTRSIPEAEGLVRFSWIEACPADSDTESVAKSVLANAVSDNFDLVSFQTDPAFTQNVTLIRQEVFDLTEIQQIDNNLHNFLLTAKPGQVYEDYVRWNGQYRIIRIAKLYNERQEIGLLPILAVCGWSFLWFPLIYIGGLWLDREKKHRLLKDIKKHGADKDFILGMLEKMRHAEEKQTHLLWLKNIISQERFVQQIKRAR